MVMSAGVTPDISISGGEILLNGYPFLTEGYTPPHYPRAISYEESVEYDIDTGTFRPVRNVTDQGPLLGVWSPFTLLCYNEDYRDRMPTPGRGRMIFEHLKSLFKLIGTPIKLTEVATGEEYWVMFGQDGLVPRYLQNYTPMYLNELTGELEDYGPEYQVQVSFFEVDPNA